MGKCNGMEFTAFMSFSITDLVMSFNIGKTMNQSQVGHAVRAIQEDYFYLKPTELKYCFENAKRGRYGTLYDRIDLAVICEWIEMYLVERTNEVIMRNENKKVEYSKQNDELFTNVFSSGKIKVKDVGVIPGKETPKPQNYKMHQKWYKQFDFCRKRFGVPESQLINRYGRAMNVDEFFVCKIEQLVRLGKTKDKRIEQYILANDTK